MWQVVTMAVLAIPTVFVCNLFGLVLWGVVTIVTDASPLTVMPQIVSIVGALVAAYLAFILLLGVLGHLVTPADDAPPAEARPA